MAETLENGTRGVTHAVLRVAAGLTFSAHGAQKIFGWFGGFGPGGGAVDLMSLFGVAGVIELVGGALLVVGLFTRAVALIACGGIVVAYVLLHWIGGGEMWWASRAEMVFLYAFIALLFAMWGAGPFSIDAIRLHPQPQMLHQREEFA